MASSSNKICENIELIKKSPSHWELIFNRPDKYNAISNDMYESVTQILDEAANDEQLVLLSITGKGKFYSSGTDLSASKASMLTTIDFEKIREESQNRIKRFVEKFITFPKILIGFINGPAIGIAVTTLALFDGVYASSSSTFSLPFIRHGMAPEGCSSFVFPILMGPIHAKETLLFDRKLTAQEAQQRGLVTQVIDDQIFQQEKEKICQNILSLPKESLLTSKALIQRWNINTLKYVNEEEVKNLKKRWDSEEFIEAILTFMNRSRTSKL